MSPCGSASTIGAGPACRSICAPARRLTRRTTEIAIQFKQAPFALFRDTPVEILTPNVLILQIQPDEGVSLQFGAKIPGPRIELGKVRMDFRYSDYFHTEPSTGYETLVYDCMIGEAILFNRADGVEAGWEVVQPILDLWAEDKTVPLEFYPAGSAGPDGAEQPVVAQRPAVAAALPRSRWPARSSSHPRSCRPISAGSPTRCGRSMPAGADWIHVDVMDGRFVPNLTIGPVVVAAVRKATAKPVDVHLMIVEPERYLDDFAKAGADHLLVHCEPSATIHLHRTLVAYPRVSARSAGVVLNPATPLSQIEYVLHLCEHRADHDRQSRFWRTEVPARRCCRRSAALRRPVRRARARPGDRGRWRVERR